MSSSAAKNSAATGSSETDDVRKMMEELGLKEAGLQDVVIEDEELPPEATRWMAIARVHTDRTYSQYWFFRNMKSAWDLARPVKIKTLEENLFIMQFNCLGD